MIVVPAPGTCYRKCGANLLSSLLHPDQPDTISVRVIADESVAVIAKLQADGAAGRCWVHIMLFRLWINFSYFFLRILKADISKNFKFPSRALGADTARLFREARS